MYGRKYSHNKTKYTYRQGKGLKTRKARVKSKELCNETEIMKWCGDVTSHTANGVVTSPVIWLMVW
jgi:hypothetical protein